ncbi:sigma-54 interaction domain-containing protein [Acidaminobacter hydrogenoformans]|uniref:Transcriptional regulator containing PAS, AAA-type ATPase, and DNA-binding Fis domains n=1 Tax=Acidaminobacter hydrogenoformans DSM 2784 TaxID=1120920 RepID=A0A1G5RPK3_9FIRM|nr:sigma 54-interacting transcriptional regulator [Acidaminobacter hydrogenoformans]SCZ76042.1 Transcriptional regulator containing PAS, AAA-type ATPase, and DNA-binding Fis domains [Acidaminobacter hydrogenoformans DSM 2784]
MKEIAVIAYGKNYAEFIKGCLEVYLGHQAELHAYSADDVDQMAFIQEKFIAISGFTVFKRVYEKIRETSTLQVMRFTLSREQTDMLKALPEGEKILLVNIDYRKCMEVITQIYEAGYRNLDLIPYFGDEDTRDKRIKTAITPNEMQLMPPGMETIINFGERVLDVESVVELAEKMGIEGVFNSDDARRARNNVMVTSGGIAKLLGENEKLLDQIKALVEMMEDGIILTDLTSQVYLANEKAKAMLRNRSQVIEGFGIPDILPELKLGSDAMSKNQKETEKIVAIEGVNLVIKVSPLYSDQVKRGNIITLRSFDELEERQHSIRSKLSGGRHEAKYVFKDIKGESAIIKEAVSSAVRIAKTDASVLITGESGTGKEVFAQSIHNDSRRNKYSFVALNCSAIPENLLESEMFGYEEGAFTGAKKGGKAGLFEIAHKGTIFLDEIGEMPIALQSKLLRVLEEKKVSRIGSLKLIDVDTRVIAATNRDLKEMIQEKKMREDLFYRLNVLPLEIPSLKKRKEDIPLLLRHFMGIMSSEWQYSPKALEKLCGYSWPGNVRELRNTAEFLSSLGKAFIEEKDLPSYIVYNKETSEIQDLIQLPNRERGSNLAFLMREGRRFEMLEAILVVLSSEKGSGQRWGRNKLEDALNQHSFDFTETEIRNGLRLLSEMGYIKSAKGRGGSRITAAGQGLLTDIAILKSMMG